MARVVLLDSGPLGEVTHPESEKRRPIREWLFRLLDAGAYPRSYLARNPPACVCSKGGRRKIERSVFFRQDGLGPSITADGW